MGAKAIVQPLNIFGWKKKKKQRGIKYSAVCGPFNYFFRCMNVKKKNPMQDEISIFGENNSYSDIIQQFKLFKAR